MVSEVTDFAPPFGNALDLFNLLNLETSVLSEILLHKQSDQNRPL